MYCSLIRKTKTKKNKTKKTAQEIKAFFVKYGRCKLCGFINLTDAKIRRFGDIISEFWIKSNFSCCKWFFFDPKIYINQVVAFCELFLSFFLFEVLLVSALNVSFGFVLKNIKISIEPFFES